MRSLALQMASGIWSTLSASARWAAEQGWVKTTRLDAGRIVSVGNIQVGGAGKTPLAALIAREAAERGLSTCILCRGYGGEWEGRGGVIAPTDAQAEPGECGDEAALLHDLAPGAFIGVGADRVAQYGRLVERAGGRFDLVILDDGFQHWKIRRDLDVVALTSATPSDTLFRDFPWAVERAHLLVWSKGDHRPDSKGRPLVKTRYRLPEPKSESRVWLVSGLADNRSVRKMVEATGYRVARQVSFPDHARYVRATIDEILAQATGEQCKVLLTGKDWVKWRKLGVTEAQVQVLEPELVFEEGREQWLQTLWGS